MEKVSLVEERTRAYGSEIFARLSRRGPLFMTPAWWDDRLMEWTMAHEALKVDLFRFVDVLPMLHSTPEITRHLREYLARPDSPLPAWMRKMVNWLPERGMLGGLTAGLARSNAERLARRFIAGSNLREVLSVVRRLRAQGLAFTVDLLGEATLTEPEAEHYQYEYLQLLEGLTAEVNQWPTVPVIDRGPDGPLPRVNASIKLSALYSQFDPIDPRGTSRAVRERLRPILRLAKERGAFINVDMEQYAYKDLTLQIFSEVLAEEEFRAWPDVGIAIQAYLKDCATDLEKLRAWVQRRGTSVWVRLVKGAYWDYETVRSAQEGWPVPVFQYKDETDANYERMSEFLLEHHDLLCPAFGSHNVRSLAHVMAVADRLHLPAGAYEVQMLYGMAEPLKQAMLDLGQRVRIYTPYGQLLPGMAYLVRRLLENTANESFLRASFIENVSEDQLLMNPALARDHRRSSAAPSSPATFSNEPLADFSREAARTAMLSALHEVKGQLGERYPLVIGGERIYPIQELESVNPAQFKQVVGRFGRATVEHANQAIAVAKAAFPGWRTTPATRRADHLRAAARILRRRRFELAAWEVFECGKQWREADADIAEAIDFCEYYALEMERLTQPRHDDMPGEENVTFYEPRGVTVVIAPWNFPLAILCGMTSAALVAGNPVIIKPAEQSMLIGAKLMEVLEEAGFPKGVINLLSGVGEEIGPALTTHPDVAVIAFTGSLPVGLILNRTGAEVVPGQQHIKRVIAELGGKNAIIVDEDADLDEAVQGVVASAFGYQGQKCSACSRAIVLESIYPTFVKRLIEATRSLKIAPAEEPGSAVGAVIDEDAYRRILCFIEKGKQEATLAYAADPGDLAREGYFIGPHIFTEVAPTATIAQEEIFGPVLAVLKAKDLTQALEIANGTAYALTGGLFSRSPRNIARVREEFRVGNLYINRKITGALVGRQPFGGFKLSGIGSKAGGPDYLLQFLLPRTITENTMRRGFAPQHDGQAGAGGP